MTDPAQPTTVIIDWADVNYSAGYIRSGGYLVPDSEVQLWLDRAAAVEDLYARRVAEDFAEPTTEADNAVFDEWNSLHRAGYTPIVLEAGIAHKEALWPRCAYDIAANPARARFTRVARRSWM